MNKSSVSHLGSLAKRNAHGFSGLVLCGVALVILVGGGAGAVPVVGVLLTAAIIIMGIGFRRRDGQEHRSIAQATDVRQAGHEFLRLISRDMPAGSSVPVDALGAEFRSARRAETEAAIDSLLDTGIQLIRQKVDCHTVAIFFPSEDGGYALRRFFSPSEHINAAAVIYPGKGVIGSFLKDGLRQLVLHDIVSDSMTLHYYTKDAGIRSLMASPMIAGDTERGTIIVDSTSPTHFVEADHTFLSLVARLIGHAVYHAYLGNENRLDHLRIAAITGIEKYLFAHLNTGNLLDKMVEIIPFAVACDRLTISLKKEEGDTAQIVRIFGAQSEDFRDMAFSIKDKTLAGLVYTRNMEIFRNFADDHYETRYSEREKESPQPFRSFCALPIGVDECRGMLLLESFKRDAFSESSRELLFRLATSAALALERIRIIDQAQTMATHDGLTGLVNHRHFQKRLSEEITRAIRYGDPLALVLCDIDHFKRINDTYGHPFGDLVLKTISSLLQKSVRDDIDIAARYGGEEFSLVLVKTDVQNAIEKTDRLRQTIAATTFKTPAGKEDIHVTMSFGIAIYGEHAKAMDALIQKADKALYRAKEGGRNRVELF